MRTQPYRDSELNQLNHTLALLEAESLQIKRIYFARKFNSDQPRIPAGSPNAGQWTIGGDNSQSTRQPSSDGGSVQPVIYRSQAFCDAQFDKDIFQCRMVGNRSCYAQAMVRRIACERGHSIPPLNY